MNATMINTLSLGQTPSSIPKTLVESAYAALRRDIIEGKLMPGLKLRVEHLKDDYGVGAGTLREALALLVSDALVLTQGQRGFRVAPISAEDFEDITRNRMLLECEALRQSIALGDDAWEALVLAEFHRLSKAEARLHSATPDSFDEWELRNRAFHHALISACSSRWMHHFLGILYQQAERYRRLVVARQPIPRDVHEEHEQLAQAAVARQSDRAAQILESHIWTTFEAVRHLPTTLFDPQ